MLKKNWQICFAVWGFVLGFYYLLAMIASKIFYLWIMSPNAWLIINLYMWEKNRDRDTQKNRDEKTKILTQYLAYTECPYMITIYF